MPPLSVMLGTQSLKGFEAVENEPAPQIAKSEEQGLNPFLRCPLPPFSTTVDTIRQWNMTGKLPVMRVIPLPTQQGAGGGVATNITNITTTASGSSGSVTPTNPGVTTIIIPVPFLPPSGTYQVTVRMAKAFQLLQVGSIQPVEVRLYSNSQTQAIDSSRLTDVSVAFEQIEGVITDVVMDSSPYQWNWENRIAANADSPQTTNIYVTVVNPSQSAGVPPTTVTVVIQPVEV